VMFKWIFWLGLIGGGVFVGGQVIPVFYNNLKIENIFEGVANGLADEPEDRIEDRMNELFRLQTVDLTVLPEEFFENLSITKENGKLEISTEYHITLWLLDKPRSVDPDSDYQATDVKGLDKLRLKTRLDFDFAPSSQ